MTVGTSEIVAKMQALKARSLSFEDYAMEIHSLVAIGATDMDADVEAVNAAFRLQSLRRRLAKLERSVAELRAQT